MQRNTTTFQMPSVRATVFVSSVILTEPAAVAAWLNVFVRKADVVKIACIAQSVNVISPVRLVSFHPVGSCADSWLQIITSPTGLFKQVRQPSLPSYNSNKAHCRIQTTYYPLQLFATLMQGTALSLHVTADAPDDAYTGPTVPAFVARLTEHTPPAARLTKWIDASGVLSPDGTQVRVAIVNRHQTQAFSIPIVFGPDAQVAAQVSVHEVWSADLRDRNGFEGEKVRSVKRAVDWQGVYECKKHSFQGK